MKLNYLRKAFALSIWLFAAFCLNAQTTVTGSITDESGEGLIGANIILTGSNGIGTITDFDGNFELTVEQAAPFSLDISYTGFSEQTIEVTNANKTGLKIVMLEGVLIGQEIVVSASRKREKVQEAPASISVINSKKLANSAQAADPVRNLVNVPGVQIQQQSAARINIEMRGSSGIFGTGTFPIMDYRSLVGPGIGTFQSDAAGLSTIDLERIEVVRGPGSALYGPGVTSGVIHFITKTPIDNPGTTLEIFGGELNTFGGAFRHATKVSDKFGFKINAHYKKGDEFNLDPNDPTDKLQIDQFKTQIVRPGVTNNVVDPTKPGTIVLTERDLDPDGDGNMLQDDWWNTAANVTFEFRPQDDLTVFVSGGMNAASAVFYNDQGQGLAQQTEFWTQARMQKGGLFAQIFYVDNNGGSDKNPTFLYKTGNVSSIARKQLEGQVQYAFDTPTLLNADWVTGIDYRQAISETDNLVYGRQENDDDFTIIGAYLQGKFELSEKLDFLVAGRFDYFNFIDESSFSPRAAIVYKPNPTNTFRASFNRASSPPAGLQAFIDFPVNVIAPGAIDVWLSGLAEPHTFDNPMIDLAIPGAPDLPFGTPGLPLAIPYGAVNELVIPSIGPGLIAVNPAFAGLVPGIEAFLRDPANAPQGVTGTFSPYNLFTQQPQTTLPPTTTAQLSYVNSFEVGYKGLIANKLGVSVDFYTSQTKGFTQFTGIGPAVSWTDGAGGIPDVGDDLGNAVAAGILPYLIEQLTPLAGALPAPPEAIAAQLAGAIGAGYNQGGQGFQGQIPAALYQLIGAVESSAVPQGDGIVHVPAGYRSFDDASYDYWGSDIGLEYYVNNQLSLFANYSFLSQTEWIPGADDDDGLPFPFYLNTPKNKWRIGANYTPDNGFRANLSFQHDDSFFASLGQFSGNTDKKNLVDAGVGYTFANGMTFDITANNLFNNEYRAFTSFPKIGRRVLARVTYTFGGNKE